MVTWPKTIIPDLPGVEELDERALSTLPRQIASHTSDWTLLEVQSVPDFARRRGFRAIDMRRVLFEFHHGARHDYFDGVCDRILDIDAGLRRRVVGQDPAIDRLIGALAAAGVCLVMRYDPFSPLPVAVKLLLIGSTGVGKTELAKATADEVYGDESRLVHIACASLGTPNAASELLGAGSGYVGYEEGGRLTEGIRRHGGACVVLFDELGKAPVDVHRMLLSAIDDGYLSDARGNRVDLSQTTIIATANFGAEALDLAALGAPRSSSVAGDLTKLPPDEVTQVLYNAARDRFCDPPPALRDARGLELAGGPRWPRCPDHHRGAAGLVEQIISQPPPAGPGPHDRTRTHGRDLPAGMGRPAGVALRRAACARRSPSAPRSRRPPCRARRSRPCQRVQVAVGAAATYVRVDELEEVAIPATPMAGLEDFGSAS